MSPVVAPHPIPCQSPSPDRSALARRFPTALLLAVVAGALLTTGARAADSDHEQILIEAVETATKLDLYGTRCRGDASERHTDNLNKTLVSELQTTVLSVEDDVFPEGDYQDVQKRIRRDFLQELSELGNCDKAKEAGYPTQLKARYDQLLEQIRAMP